MKKKIVAVVPARLGSNRVKVKNLRLLNGKPLISYIIEALKESSLVHEIVINSDSHLFESIAEQYNVKYFNRPKELATSQSMIDDYIYHFLKNTECDILVVANPTSPFLKSKQIDDSITHYLVGGYDTQLACEDVKTHCFMNGKPINFSTCGQHPRSQDLVPVQALNFAITIWNRSVFMHQYEKVGHAVYSGNIGFYSFSGLAKIDIDWEEDFQLAQMIMENIDNYKDIEPSYDPVIQKLLDDGMSTEN